MQSNVTSPDFNDERLKYIYLSARLGTMRAAADALGVAPSSVSRQIAQLERFLGLPLVQKRSRSVKLTQAGEHVVAYYRERLSQKEFLVGQLDDLKGLRTGHYTLAVGEGFISKVLLSTVQSFTKDFPGVSLDIITAASPEVMEMVCEDLAHLGIVFDPPEEDPRVSARISVPQPMKLMVPSNHPLAAKESVKLVDLVNVPLILPKKAIRLKELLRKAEVEGGSEISLLPNITTNSLLFIREYAKAGFAATIMPEIAMVDELDAGYLVAVPLDHEVLSNTNVHVVTRFGRHLPKAIQILLNLLSNTMSRWLASHEVTDH